MPLWLGLWANPGDIIPLIKDGKKVRWLVLGGEIVNWSGETVSVAGLHVTVLTPGGTIIADRECNYDFRRLQYPDRPRAAVPDHGELNDPYTVFVDGIEIPTAVDLSAGLTVRLVLNWAAARRLVWLDGAHRPRRLPGDAAHAVAGAGQLVFRQWHDADRVQSARPLPRALQLRPYAARREWRDLRRADDDNDSFFCYSEEIHAMADGVVLGCQFMAPENHGHVTDGGDASNYVILGHDGGLVYPRRSRYEHLQPKGSDSPSNPGQPLAVGDTVQAGDVIGYLGNSGHSSEPHLHFDLWGIDPSGHPRPWPMRFSDLRGVGSKRALSGTPTIGDYETT